jgi:hypothetical protein
LEDKRIKRNKKSKKENLLVDRFIPSRKATNFEVAFAIQHDDECDIENQKQSSKD